MSKVSQVFIQVLQGNADANIRFAELLTLLEALGFNCRIRGDHYIHTIDGIEEIINLQPQNGKAKPYQVKQVRNLIHKYKLGGDING